MKKKTRIARKAPRAFSLHAAVQRQLRRLKVAPGTSPAETAHNLKAFVDTLIEFTERAARTGTPIVAMPVARGDVSTTPIQDEPHAPADAARDEHDLSDWRHVLGIARGATVTPISLKAAFHANLTKPGALHAYNLAKAELGIF